MPTFEIVPKQIRKPRLLRQRKAERHIEETLRATPRLLGHPSEVKPRDIVWFWHHRNGPGDLWGIDELGHLVIVEVKKRLGRGEEKKAISQLNRADVKGRHFTLKDVQECYEEWRRYGGPGELSNFADEFRRVTGRKLHLKCESRHHYVVAGHFTAGGGRSASKRTVGFVMMLVLEVEGKTVVSTERL